MKRHKPLIVVGHGSHSAVVVEAAKLAGYTVEGIIDTRNLKNLSYIKKFIKNFNFVIAIGDNYLRKKVFQDLEKSSASFVSVIHPSAIISKSSTIKKGVFIAAGAILSTSVRVSENVIINTGAIIDHHSKIGAHTHIAPGVKIAGKVNVGSLSFIGIGSSVIEEVKIKNEVIVGGGAVVIDNLASNLKYVGVPAKRIIGSSERKILFLGRKNCEYSKKIYFNLKKINNKITFLKSSIDNKKEIKSKISKMQKNEYDYLISFRNYLIIDKKTLDKIRISSINFHPGPPAYRGIGCANFALINKEKKYGCTCHIMHEKIDKGEILDVKYFNLKKNININSLLSQTHKAMYEQSAKIINAIFKEETSINFLKKINKKFHWSKKLYKRKHLNNLYKINHNVEKNKFRHLLRACDTKIFRPYIIKNSKKFIYFNHHPKKYKSIIELHGKKFFYLNK
tara:strand:+ start:14055 stop:15407 length:1353 start_codon:yes stop_codon:yes gene_type:complete